MNLQELASEAYDHFETATRTNGDKFVRTTDDAPTWVRDLCRAAHDSSEILPDDYRFEFISDALAAIADNENEDYQLEAIDNDVDVYTSSLTAWLNSDNRRVFYLDEVLSDGVEDGFQLLARAQYAERREVYEAVKTALEARLTEEDEDDDDSDED
jgi:hypothetical protein